MTSSPLAFRIVSFSHRTAARLLLGSVLCALALAATCGLAGAASSTTSSGKISAHLTKTSFKSSQAGTVKLVYKFSVQSKSFSYLLTLKKGKKWQTVKSVTWAQGHGRFVVYERVTDLPRVDIAGLAAEGYLSLPGARR